MVMKVRRRVAWLCLGVDVILAAIGIVLHKSVPVYFGVSSAIGATAYLLLARDRSQR